MAFDLTGMRFQSGGEEWLVTGPCDWNPSYWNIECPRNGKQSCRAGGLLVRLLTDSDKAKRSSGGT